MNRALIAAVAATALFSTSAFGASSKFAGHLSDQLIFNDQGPALETVIKTPNGWELLVGVSLQSTLFTQNVVGAKNGGKSKSIAEAGATVTLWVDGDPFHSVTYNRRLVELSATLGGVIESCTDGDLDGTIDIANDCIVTDEEIDLLIETTSANHFNFIVPNLPSGEHDLAVTISPIINVDAEIDGGSYTISSAGVFLGSGSITVEQVRAIKDADLVDLTN